ncbi:MAG: hypothetical protein LBP26_02300 [Clostridiales bacterium]|nr:hypothetical protein [Clostridiales bacterium]
MKKVSKILSVMLVMLFCLGAVAACVGDSDKTKEKLEKKDYKVQTYSGDALSAFGGMFAQMPGVGELSKVEAYLMASKGEGTDDMVTVIWFKETADAKEAYKQAKESLKKMEETDAEAAKKMKVKRSGKAVISGTKDAVKACG